MNNSFKLTGGARIGSKNATYPFADLTVDKEKLKINASIIGNLEFSPKDITSIEKYEHIPFFGQGVKINHTVEAYDEKVIFWTFKDPGFVIGQIWLTGFLENKDVEIKDHNLIKKQNQGGIPIKKSAAIIFVVIWNLLFLSSFISFAVDKSLKGLPFGIGVKIALSLTIVVALLSLVSENFRQLILKEDRGLNDIKKFAFFIIFICGTMLISFFNFQ